MEKLLLVRMLGGVGKKLLLLNTLAWGAMKNLFSRKILSEVRIKELLQLSMLTIVA